MNRRSFIKLASGGAGFLVLGKFTGMEKAMAAERIEKNHQI